MSYDIDLSPGAAKELRAAWDASTDFKSFLDALRTAKVELASHPFDVGESRDDHSLRVGFFSPLTIYFAVSPEERLVRIVHVVAWPR